MDFSKRFKRFVAASSMLLIIFSLSACGGAVDNTLPKNEAGHGVEDFVPSGSNFVFVFDTTDEEQKADFDLVWEKLTLGKVDGFYRSLMDEALLESDFSYDDLKEIFGESKRLLMAMDFDPSSLDELDEDVEGVIELYGNDDFGDLVFAVNVSDVKKTEEFMNLLAKDETVLLSDTDGYLTLANSVDGTHMVLVDDFLVLTTSSDKLEDALARYNGKLDSLNDDDKYLEAFGSLKGSQLGHLYINLGGLEFNEEMSQALSLYGLNLTDYQILGFRAESDGFSFSSFAQFDKKELKKFDLDLDSFAGPGSYLDKRLNGENIMMYIESYNIAQAMKFSPTLQDPAISDAFQSFFGKNIEDGLFSWMDKGFVFAIYEGGSVVPGFTIAVDAKSNLEAAKEFFFKLDGQIGGLVAVAQADADYLKKASHDDLTVISIDMSAVGAAEGEIYPGLDLANIDFTYGLTEDGLFVISLQEDFYENYGKSVVAEASGYKSALGLIGGLDRGTFYIDFDSIVDYTTEVSELVLTTQLERKKAMNAFTDISEEEAEVSLAESESEFRDAVDTVVDVLSQIDFVVSGSEIVGSTQTKSKGYLKLK